MRAGRFDLHYRFSAGVIPISSGQQPPDAALQGQRILIVEDQVLLAMELQALLERQGCTVLGPVNTLARALALLDNERPDAALLDLDLNGQRSTSVACALSALNVPFVVVTGYGAAALSTPELRDAPLIEKPVNHRSLVRLLSEMVLKIAEKRHKAAWRTR